VLLNSARLVPIIRSTPQCSKRDAHVGRGVEGRRRRIGHHHHKEARRLPLNSFCDAIHSVDGVRPEDANAVSEMIDSEEIRRIARDDSCGIGVGECAAGRRVEDCDIEAARLQTALEAKRDALKQRGKRRSRKNVGERHDAANDLVRGIGRGGDGRRDEDARGGLHQHYI